MSREAEQAVLGACLLDQDCAHEAVDALAPEMFSQGLERELFRAITDMYWAGEPIDPVTILRRLPEDGDTRACVVQMAQLLPTLSHVGEYIRIVQEDWQLGELRADLGALALSHGTVAESLEELEGLLARHRQLLGAAREEGVTPFAQAFQEFQGWLEDSRDESAHTGFPGLDGLLGGLLPGTVFTLAARPGMGKTDFAVNLAMRMAKGGVKVLYFTMEMTHRQLLQRVLSNLLELNSIFLRDKSLSQKDLESVRALTESLRQWDRLSFVQESQVSLERVRHLVDLWKPRAVVIDHVGLMARPPARDAFQALGKLSRGLKQLALDKGLSIVQLAQMNRQIENRKKRRPVLSDLRESGDLEQDSDYVAFLDPVDETRGRPLSGPESCLVRLYLEKHRYGPTGVLQYHWQPQYHRYRE